MYGLTRVWFGAVKISNNIKKFKLSAVSMWSLSFCLPGRYVLSPKAASAGYSITSDN